MFFWIDAVGINVAVSIYLIEIWGQNAATVVDTSAARAISGSQAINYWSIDLVN